MYKGFLRCFINLIPSNDGNYNLLYKSMQEGLCIKIVIIFYVSRRAFALMKVLLYLSFCVVNLKLVTLVGLLFEVQALKT